MFNLIKRDVILQKRLLLTFIPFILVFIIAGSHPALIFLVASIFIPFNAFAYDEKAETNILLNSLPYTRTQIIASRYLDALIYMLLAIGLTSLALFAFDKSFTLTDIAIGGGLFLVFSAFTFPLFYIFKPGHITTVVIFGFILLTALGPPIFFYIADHIIADHIPAITQFFVNLSTQALYTGAAVVIVPLYTVSWGVTTIIYQQKAF